jgi:hypothetical protein
MVSLWSLQAMNRSMFRTLGKVVLGLSFAFALSTMNLGCQKGGCEPCKTSKNCPPGCGKGCCKKAEAPCGSGCSKPCCKKT